jgi:small conductance mechanosensitive channel
LTISEFGTSMANVKIHFWINSNDFIGSTVVLNSEVMRKVIVVLLDKNVGMPADILELKIYQEEKPIPITLKKDA